MRPQPATAFSPPAGGAPPRRAPSLAAVDDADLDIPILGRRDVAVVPWVVICTGALALALSQILRPAGDGHAGHVDLLTIAGSIAGACIAGGMILAHRTAVVARLRGAAWTYLLSAGGLLAGLAVIAVADRGLATVGLMAMPFTTAYLGLVLPLAWARISIAIVLLTLVGIQAVRPEADSLEVASVFALALTGGAIGLLVRHAHHEAWEESLLLSRSDQLTRGLNRRGFLEQLSDALREATRTGEPIALLIIDLDDFKRVNDTEGHAAGDALLAWVGETIPTELPDDAAFGRLGGDEFAIVLPRASDDAVAITGRRVRATVGARIGAAVGAATCSPNGVVDIDSLLHCADTALYAAKRDPAEPVQVVPARIVPVETHAGRPAPARPAALTYAQLRAAGGPPKRRGSTLYEGRTISLAFLCVGAAGATFVASTIATGGTSFYERVIQYLGIPWVVANVVIAGYYSQRRYDNDRPPRFAFYSAAFLVAAGIAAAALSTGSGILAPITAGLFLKVFFDFCFAPRDLALRGLAIVGAYWAAVVVLGPADALWAAPYELAMLAGGYMFGTIGRNAFAEATAVRLRLADTDGLTGLLNRRGFEHAAERARVKAESFAVITFDLDDFKQINDTLGHAAGDGVLRDVAAATREALPEAYAVGRLGGDEFVAAVPAASLDHIVALADRLDARLAAVASSSVGCAIHPMDGATLDDLLVTADERAYAVKRARAATGAPSIGGRAS